ncbi:hypothetical protein BDC45DRAFT_99105 [Circinella umbellata]|nr:hypothetical protein BDC45DRAFT_99105 [Circinella umbellata]
MPETYIEDSQEEKQVPSIQKRVLPRRGATISKKVYAMEASIDNDEGDVVTEPPKSISESAPPKPRKRKNERRKIEQEPQSDEEEPVPLKQEKRETRMMTRSRQENVSSSINNQEPSSDTNTGKGKESYQGRRRNTTISPPDDIQEKNSDENAGVDQSPVLEYEVDFEMPMIVLDGAPVDDEAKQETKIENELVEEEKEEEKERSPSPQNQKPIETAPPRKKRKLRGGFRREFDYEEHLLSPLSKVNNALRES